MKDGSSTEPSQVLYSGLTSVTSTSYTADTAMGKKAWIRGAAPQSRKAAKVVTYTLVDVPPALQRELALFT